MKRIQELMMLGGMLLVLMSMGGSCGTGSTLCEQNGAAGPTGQKGTPGRESTLTDHIAGDGTSNPPSEILPAD